MTPTAYPLQWPEIFPKTNPNARQHGYFKTDTAAALKNLRKQLDLMGAKNVLLSSNYTLGLDNPKEPGVCAYFDYDGMNLAIPCDRWAKISHNIQAIALTVEAMRGMERWGAKHMIRAMFTGFRLLPGVGETGAAWWVVLGVAQNAGQEEIKEAYRSAAKKHHPDVGGDLELFRAINEAYNQAIKST